MGKLLIVIALRFGIPIIFIVIGFVMIKYNKELNRINYDLKQKFLRIHIDESIIEAGRFPHILGGIVIIIMALFFMVNINKDLIIK